jgi:RimJ/RimL family protein N-acetyltransferase
MLNGTYTGLRAVERGDLAQLKEWRNRPEYRRYFREHRELSDEHQTLWFEKTVRGDPGTRMFSITGLADGRLLGACGLCYINWVDRNADFSIYIGADDLYIDETLAPDAARTLIRYAFHELSLHRLWSEIYDFDMPKQKFFRTLGFTLDGRHRQTHWTEGMWHDSLFYSLLEPEFQDLEQT